eukprot:CAMPEP_0201553202 /NCGR_PEP_ID=MMETSP0173_2-20130828/19500_1 /ASSEMBLY_ACC=CAM_ASM_000268 /TAXON_ID=218659 /ORGANISM="Vexillifera sp., Strain DIVA3 564/2" /LENGTH=498 /DNA_ID=CAMNT_0047963829 /DNA_START=14 /DNA_END=1507 /DNA_ORIENTATION=+
MNSNLIASSSSNNSGSSSSNTKLPIKSIKNIAIVGAGLSGVLSAVKFSSLPGSPHIDVFERRSDFRLSDDFSGRSINLALSCRGRTALESVGIETSCLQKCIPMYRRVMHAENGSLSEQPYGVNDQHIFSAGREMLLRELLAVAESKDNVKFHFSTKCTSVNLRNSSLSFIKEGASETTKQYDLIIGADGVYSYVRRSFVREKGFNFAQTYVCHGYKELTINPTDQGEFALPRHEGLHIWPRGNYMLIGLPNPDKTFTMTLFMPWDVKTGGENSFEALSSLTDTQLCEWFETRFPDAYALMPHFLKEWKTNPSSHLVTVKCDPWALYRAVLVGDAAHAIVPFYGQGMNASLQDVMVLYEILVSDEFEFVEDALDHYSNNHKPNGDAISDLSFRNYVEMRSHVASSAWLLRKQIERLIHRLMPEKFIPLYSMVAFTNIPYAQVIERDQRQQSHLNKFLLSLGITLPLSAALLWWKKDQLSSLLAQSPSTNVSDDSISTI